MKKLSLFIVIFSSICLGVNAQTTQVANFLKVNNERSNTTNEVPYSFGAEIKADLKSTTVAE
jgi:hypothetical protein